MATVVLAGWLRARRRTHLATQLPERPRLRCNLLRQRFQGPVLVQQLHFVVVLALRMQLPNVVADLVLRIKDEVLALK